MVSPGTYNVFQYTQAVYLLPYAVLAVPLVTVFQPRLAEMSGLAHGSVGAALARLAERSTRTVLAAGLVGAGLLAAVAPAAHAVFGQLADRHGSDPVPGMTEALTWMAPGVVGLGLLLHAGRMLLALDRSRMAVIATATAWLVTALASVVAVQALAPEGGDGVATLVGLGIAAHGRDDGRWSARGAGAAEPDAARFHTWGAAQPGVGTRPRPCRRRGDRPESRSRPCLDLAGGRCSRR